MIFNFLCVFVFLRGISLIIQFMKSPCYKTRCTTPMCFMCFCVFSIQCRKGPRHMFCVFLCFFFWLEAHTRSHHPRVWCVFVFFWTNLVQTKSQHRCVLCVFVFFLISAKMAQPCILWVKKKAEPCVLCVFVFFGWKFRPNHTTHVFDVFLCLLIPGGYGVKLVFCVFLGFFGQIWIRPGYNTHVFYVFLCFF